MKKRKEFGLNTITDLKVFILFLIDHIRYPVDHSTIMKIIDVSADTDADAIKRAEEKFNKYLSRVGYKVKIVMFEPIFA